MYDTPPPERRHRLIDDPRRTDPARNFGVRALQTKPGWIALAYIPPWPTQLVATDDNKPAFFRSEQDAKLAAYQQIVYVLNREIHEGTPDGLTPIRLARPTDGGRDGNR